MGLSSSSMFSRFRSLALFALVLLACSAVPVLAAEEPEGTQPQTEDGASENVTPPGASQVNEAIVDAEREEERRKGELNEPEAIAERLQSQHAYTGLSPDQAEQLLLQSFPEQLAKLDAEPARSLADVKVEKVFEQTAATISEGGHGYLLEAGIPIRTKDDEGNLSKVDLDLERTEEGFQPENPLTEVAIPESASDPIAIGEEGLAVAAVDADATVRRFDEQDAYYPEAQTDTDILVAPTGFGVELFDQLRSIDSPEELHFHFDLPAGAILQPNGGGGVDVVKEGQPVATVSPPTAVDAQGTQIPVQMTVDGATVTVHVPHRGGDFAYPILVDPAINEDFTPTLGQSWYGGANLDALPQWQLGGTDPTMNYILASTSCLNVKLCSTSGRGLFLSSVGGGLPAGTYTEWYWTVPGETTYIPGLYPEPSSVFWPYFRNDNNCTNLATYPLPYDFEGQFDAAGNWTYLDVNKAHELYYGAYGNGKGMAFGLGAGPTGGSNPCWRDLLVGGVSVRLDDPEAPTLTSVTGFPTGWINGSAGFTVTANIMDPGLGVRNVVVYPSGRPPVPYVSPGSECPGTKLHPCARNVSAQFNLGPALFDEGEKKVEVSGYDPTGEVSGTYTAQVKVDRTPPSLDLGKAFAEATEETEGDAKDPEKWDDLSLPVYNLEVKATDGSLASGETKRSGVKLIKIFIDGWEAKSWSQTCPASSCPMTQTYPVQVNDVGADVHHVLKVIAQDQAGNVGEREIEFEYVPATGIKDEYVLQRFPLPDGKDHSDEEVNHGPELAVNVINGNVVYHERDVDIEGPNVDLEVERFYNSEQAAGDSEQPASVGQWGRGWSLAQTPELQASGSSGTLLAPTGVFEGEVELPSGPSEERFDPQLQAVVAKTAGGAYTVTDATGESGATTVFNASGQTTEMQTAGPASVDYSYEAGALSEIAVDDPNSSSAPPPVPPALPPAGTTPAYTSTFGATGAGNGQLTHPADVARDSAGNLWVVDQGNNRIEQFGKEGEFLKSVGTLGAGNGQFNRPTAIAISGAGSILVADAGNSRIEVFNGKGEFVKTFGAAGSGNGQFSSPGPEGIAVDTKGNVLVSDTFAGRIEKFSEAGEFLKAFGTKGSGSGQIAEPLGLDVAFDGSIFVADWQNNRVSVFNEAGEFVRQFGSEGAGNGQFKHPGAVAVDARGKVWITDQDNARVQEFGPAGEYVAQFGTTGSDAGQFGYPSAITAGPKGRLWVVDTGANEKRTPGPSPNAPTAAYTFDETSGTTAKDSAGAHTGTVTSPSWVEGKYGKALSFNGTSSCVSVPNGVDLQLSGSFTLEAWMKPTTVNQGAPIFFKEAESFYGYSLFFGAFEAGYVSGYVADKPSQYIEVEAPEKLTANVWNHVAMSSDGTTLRLYLNGKQVDTAPAKAAMESKGPLLIGCAKNFSEYFKGQIDNARIYNRALSGAEIETNKAAAITSGSPPPPPGSPTAAYAFDETSGTSAKDAAGSHTGTVTAPSWVEGKFGKALAFNGTSSCVSVPNSVDLQLSGSFTIEAWVNPTTVKQGAPIFFKEAESFYGYSLFFGAFEEGHVEGFIADKSQNYTEVESPGKLAVNTWTHVSMTSDGTTFRLYVNGSQVDTGSAKAAAESNGPLLIGCAKNFGEYFNGKIDNIRIYPRALSAAEVETNKGAAVTDAPVAPKGNRVQQWTIPNFIPDYSPAAGGSFGSAGSANGQLNMPSDVAADSPTGTLWVADASNNRIQKFDSNGSYLSKFGTLGSGNGQLSRPTAVALDQSGNLWVADAKNNRIQKFNSNGEFLLKAGSLGSGNGSLSAPEGIAVDPEGNIWVSDTQNNRLEVFNPQGEFVMTVGSKGSGPGQLLEPNGLAFGRDEHLFVADWGNNRIDEFDREGQFVTSFGSEGSGAGQLQHPAGIDIDSSGVVWVTDSGNGRIELFDEAGGFISVLGSKGSGAGQFSLDRPAGIAVDAESGRAWIADAKNARIQKWVTPAYQAEEEATQIAEEPNDPAVAITTTSSGLVTSVQGAGAGTNSYTYSGSSLASHSGPEGETKFESDAGGRITKITLPNGTFATIKYDATYRRATSVTVDPAGAEPAKTTNFTYQLEPLKTTVEPQGAPFVNYEIGTDGSVARWSNVVKPPELVPSGTLWFFRETPAPIATGLHNLEIQAHSEEGIASIEVISGGNVVVSEKACSQNPEVPGIECKDQSEEWVIETGSLPPGIMQVEAVVEDRLGGKTSQRFWVNIPYTPPPPPGEPIKPTFGEIRSFREMFGLDIDLNPAIEQQQINNRIYNLLAAWNNPHTPDGEVARSSADRWGVPMRAVDVAEMEYREWYLTVDATAIAQWAASHAATTYGGYSVDNRAGGKIVVGFTTGQSAALEALKSSGLVVAPARIVAAPTPPQYPVTSLYGYGNGLAEAPESATIVQVSLDPKSNRLTVGATNVAAAQSWIVNRFGAGAPITVQEDPGWYGAGGPIGNDERFTPYGPLFAGQGFGKYATVEGGPGRITCTVGLGASEQIGKKETGEATWAQFVLTAGHCFDVGDQVGRWENDKKESHPKTILGSVRRNSAKTTLDHFATDVLAVRLNSSQPPREILRDFGQPHQPITGAIRPAPGMPICSSGAKTGRVRHGEMRGETNWLSIPTDEKTPKGNTKYYPPMYEPMANMRIVKGDSGGPIWRCGSGQVIGLASSGTERGDFLGIAPLFPPEAPEMPLQPYTPFKPDMAPGILQAPEMGDLHLLTAG
jgi:sugar lactone lactonase YvrE